MSPLAPKGSLKLAKLAVTNVIGMLECDRQMTCPITLQVSEYISVYVLVIFAQSCHVRPLIPNGSAISCLILAYII